MVLADGNAATVTQLYAGGSRLQSLSTSTTGGAEWRSELVLCISATMA